MPSWGGIPFQTNPVLAVKHRNIALRRGIKKTNVAIGHKILKAAYYVLRDKTPFISPLNNKEILEMKRKKKIERLEKELKAPKNTSV